jgi:hypothetical protein
MEFVNKWRRWPRRRSTIPTSTFAEQGDAHAGDAQRRRLTQKDFDLAKKIDELAVCKARGTPKRGARNSRERETRNAERGAEEPGGRVAIVPRSAFRARVCLTA